MLKPLTALLFLGLSAGVASSHAGATGVVKKRMDGMKEISAATKALGAIKVGAIPYTPDVIRRAAAQLSEHGEAARHLFPEGSLMDPSEAVEAIWTDRDGFDRLLDEMIEAAARLDAAAEDRDASLRVADDVADTCKSCHEKYRQKSL
jgi:cytochrome c556